MFADNRLWKCGSLQTKVCGVTEALAIFGQNLKRARKRRRLSQERLGEIADVHRTHISKIERNLCEPGAETVARLIVALSLEGGQLFEGVEPEGIEKPLQSSAPAERASRSTSRPD